MYVYGSNQCLKALISCLIVTAAVMTSGRVLFSGMTHVGLSIHSCAVVA